MKLIEKIYQYRRDFDWIYECEWCGEKEEHQWCYDDRNFHDNVTPTWKCKKCDKSTNDLWVEKEIVSTKYASYEVV